MNKLTTIEASPLQGGCITAKDKALLPFGAFSWLQNMRNTWPGFEQRRGQRKLHTTADSTNKVLSLYQFAKAYTTERRTYAQMSDGDVLEASNNPPTVTSGVFGSEVFSGSSGQIPASWGVLGDLCFHSNGKDQHQIIAGSGSVIERFIVFKGAAAIPDVPIGGEDYSDEVSDGQAGTVALLDSLDTYANFDCIFFRTPVPCKSITVTVVNANGNAATSAVYYWKSDHTWAEASGLSDGTAAAGATFAQTGTISWTAPTDLLEKYAFGSCGFWYQIRVSAALDSSVSISGVTYAADWQPIRNIWDGVAQYGIEVHVEGTTQWETHGAAAVDLSELANGKKVYIAFSDPVDGIYLDPGATPNATGTTITSLKYWTGAAWTSVGTINDGSAGLSQAGWVTFPRCPAQPQQLHTSMYQAYWYEIIWSATISVDTVVAIQGMPYFNIEDFGKSRTNCVWKDRVCYTFDQWGAYIYVSGASAPFCLNGIDYGILKAGDGRANRVVSMRRYYNELMVWQEELGVEGGCLTIFEGYSPATFGKIVISSKVGSMNAKSTVVVDGVLTATKTDEALKTLAFFLSRYGVCACDGRTVYIVSDDIQNYFDTSREECIRYGYEQEMWLEHDPTYNVLRIGLVCGATATTCNVFPVFDLVTKTWSFDTPAQELSCMANVEGSGATPVVQLGGGVDDGTVYQMNYGDDDVSTAVDARVEIALGHKAQVIELAEMVLRFASQDKGTALLTIKENEYTKFQRALALIPEKAGQTSRRHRFKVGATSDMLSMEIRNAARGENLKIYDMGAETYAWTPR